MVEARKVVITCAVTGTIHTPTMSPHLPVTPDEIVADALAAAGAARLHLHARDPETGQPDQMPEAFCRFLPRIKQQTDAVINITTGVMILHIGTLTAIAVIAASSSFSLL